MMPANQSGGDFDRGQGFRRRPPVPIWSRGGEKRHCGPLWFLIGRSCQATIPSALPRKRDTRYPKVEVKSPWRGRIETLGGSIIIEDADGPVMYLTAHPEIW
jgi:hypothetical protein